MTDLIPPYGGKLTCLMAEGAQLDALRREASSLPSLVLNRRQLCDLELLLNGALSPLTGFMNHADYTSVVSGLQLADGTFWPMPLTLDTVQAFASALAPGDRITLRGGDGHALAILTVGEVWKAEKSLEARHVYGTDDADHPGMACLAQGGCHYVGGSVEGLALPRREDFTGLRLTPRATREALMRQGRHRAVAFQPHHVMHRAQFEFTLHSAEDNNAGLLIQAIDGEQPTPDFFTRIRCYQALLPHYPDGLARLVLTPLAPRPAGVREVLWRAIIARNYGCTHFIIGGDAGAGEIRRGTDALAPGRIQPLAEHFATIGVAPLTFPRMVYVPALGQYMPEEYVPPDQAALAMPACELRRRIRDGREEIPAWASFPEVVAELHKRQPMRPHRGMAILLSGPLATAELATGLGNRIMELTGRAISHCAGAECAALAIDIVKHGGTLICNHAALHHVEHKGLRKAVGAVGGLFSFHLAPAGANPEIHHPHGAYAHGRGGSTEEESRQEIHAADTSEALAQVVHALTAAGYLVSAA